MAITGIEHGEALEAQVIQSVAQGSQPSGALDHTFNMP